MNQEDGGGAGELLHFICKSSKPTYHIMIVELRKHKQFMSKIKRQSRFYF